ncbi:hypothetical protein [Schlesneria sp. T3-172]|uniref:hypothetical protein n=1 Tax=Schlesneria TaxID=656899 RepID=UPI002EFC4A4A
MSASISLEGRQKKIIPGRALYVAANGDLYLCRGCQIYRSCDRGQTWLLDCYVPSFGWKHHCSRVRVLARLLRWYIAALHVLPDGSRLAIARDGIYRAAAGEQQMTRVFQVERGSRPLNFSVDGSRVLFGEYGSGLENSEVLIYVSEDSGQSFQAGFRFPQGDIRHVHHVMVDPFEGNYWVLVGDFGRQTGVGVLSRDLKHLEWLGRGTQRYRAVSALIDRDGLTYGTDSDRDHNFIVRLDRKTGRIEELLQVEGSSLYAAQFGSLRLISTAVEPNPYCRSRECCLYGSTEGGDWQRLAAHRKDVLSPVYFQFGALVLPYTQQTRDGQSPSESDLMYSGQAVTGLDGRVALIHGNREPGNVARAA